MSADGSSVIRSFLLQDKGTAQAVPLQKFIFLRTLAEICLRLVWYDFGLEKQTNIPLHLLFALQLQTART
jgi:hypothetical protein